jgi:hypothetical protein
MTAMSSGWAESLMRTLKERETLLWRFFNNILQARA